jgi:ribosomal protein S12 methylthiotransferase
MDAVVAEAARLAAVGVRELNIVAQDSTLYGADLRMKGGLAKLLGELEGVDGIDWIRVMYLYPALVGEKLLATIAGSKKIVPYFDMPLQHADDAILSRMRRPETNRSVRSLIRTIRRDILGAALRTAFIVGFPGETDAHFETLMELVDEARFDHMGAFVYSPEEGTEAATFGDPIPDAVARRRFDRLMARQKEISAELQRAKIGMRATVMVDGFDAEENLVTGRLATQAPRIDGSVILDGVEASPGTMVDVVVTGATEYDLIGAPFDGEPA